MQPKTTAVNHMLILRKGGNDCTWKEGQDESEGKWQPTGKKLTGSTSCPAIFQLPSRPQPSSRRRIFSFLERTDESMAPKRVCQPKERSSQQPSSMQQVISVPTVLSQRKTSASYPTSHCRADHLSFNRTVMVREFVRDKCEEDLWYSPRQCEDFFQDAVRDVPYMKHRFLSSIRLYSSISPGNSTADETSLRRVLIVESRELIRHLFVEWLRGSFSGSTIVTAATAAEAEEVLACGHVDAIIIEERVELASTRPFLTLPSLDKAVKVVISSTVGLSTSTSLFPGADFALPIPPRLNDCVLHKIRHRLQENLAKSSSS